MNSKVNQHTTPADLAPSVAHNSGNLRSTPAGGEVPRSQYEQPRSPKNGYEAPKGE